MSAFICSDKHISAIVRWASRHNVIAHYGNPTRSLVFGAAEREAVELLYAENLKSVNYRYKEETAPEAAVYLADAPDLSAVEVIKACRCLEYQSCEHPEWEASTAKRLLAVIINAAITKLPGYDAAGWSIN